MASLADSDVDNILQGSPMSQDDANAIIMAARAHWFDDEVEAEAGEPDDGAKTDATAETEQKS